MARTNVSSSRSITVTDSSKFEKAERLLYMIIEVEQVLLLQAEVLNEMLESKGKTREEMRKQVFSMRERFAENAKHLHELKAVLRASQ